MIPVTAAIIEKDGLILATRRGPNVHLAGHWEFPGGKIEQGETPEECLKRELREEFSIQCEIGDFIAESIYDYGHNIIQLLGYHAQHIDGSFQLTDHDAIRWLPIEQLSNLTWAPADIPLVDKLQNDFITEENLKFYRLNAQSYIDETKDLDMHLLRQKFTDLLPTKSHILDLGSGSGRDSRAFIDLGHTVTAVDGSPEIAETTSKFLGQKVSSQLIQDLNEIARFDGIWASASLLHIPKAQITATLQSIETALKPGAVCYMSFKYGEEERWDERGRFYSDYSVQTITEILEELPNIDIIEITQTTSILRDQPQCWLNVFLRKNIDSQEDLNKMSIKKRFAIYRDFFFSKKERTPQAQLPQSKVQLEDFSKENNVQLKAVWLGHSSLLINLDGYLILTDPIFQRKISPVGPTRFHSELPLETDALPAFDAVIISHDHYDHLNKYSIQKLTDKTHRFIVPLLVGEKLVKWGVPQNKIIELGWWDEFSFDQELTIAATPAQHFSGRGLFDKNKTLWASWVMQTQNHSLFFSGDSGYFEGFKPIGEKYGPFDVTFLECGAYNEQWPKVHMFPEQTVQAHLDLGGKILQPIHWATFNLALHPWSEPMERLVAAARSRGVEVATPVAGESVDFHNFKETEPWWASIAKRN